MWSRVKKFGQKMEDEKKLELAMEAIHVNSSEVENPVSDQRVPETELPVESDNLQDLQDDESSIEAIDHWSDFDEDELEIAKALAEKEFPTVPSTSATTTLQNLEGHSDKDSPTSVLSLSSSQNLNDIDSSVSDITAIVQSVQDLDDEKIINNDDEISKSILSVTSMTSCCDGDKSSNAAVLDDGPIWGKGAKSYKFHENQTINQKLTFGVLISIVLAIGIGVGNLVAYNEYEAEFNKPLDHQHCPVPIHSSAIHMDAPSPRNTPYDRATVSENLNDYPPSTTTARNVYSDHPKNIDPFMSHTETLKNVVKSIDDLSKKIDLFQQNTTRHLSGIIIMNDNLNNLRGRPLTQKTNGFPKQNNMGSEEFSKFLPTFNDDLSSWEKNAGGEQHNINFDDPVCPPKTKQKTQSSNEKLKVDKLPPPQPILKSLQEEAVDKTTSDDVQIEDEKVNIEGPQGQHGPPEFEKQEKKEKKKQKQKQKMFMEQKDKKKKDWEKVGQDEKENKRRSPPVPQLPDELKNDQNKFVEKEGSTLNEQGMNKNKYAKHHGKKVKRDESEKKFDGDKESTDKKIKKVKPKKNVESEGQEVMSDQQSSGKGRDKKTKKVNSGRKGPKDNNNNFQDSHSLPEPNPQHKVKENSEGKTRPQGAEFQKDKRKYKKVSSKDPKYKRGKKDPDQKDWTTERAKMRETQRVQQNWNSDFNEENQGKIKRKRSQNWQIERDRIREKIRKVDN